MCASADLDRQVVARRYAIRAFGGAVDVEFAVCRACGFIFQRNPLSEDAYRAYYDDNNQPRTLRVHAIETAVHEKQAAFLGTAADLAGKRVLEIGPSAGKFLNFLAAERGAETWFQEFNAEARALLRANGHRDGSAATDGMDVVVLRHVLEHIVEPTRFLDALSGRLSEGGAVFAEVPDWSVLDTHTDALTFEHVNHFSAASLTRVFEGAGYAVAKLATDRTPGYSTSPNRVLRILAHPLPADARAGSRTEALLRYIDEIEGRYFRAIDGMVAARGGDWRLGLYAASWLCEMVLQNTNVRDLAHLHIFDRDAKKQRAGFYGLPVDPPERVIDLAPETVLITSSYEAEIRQDLQAIGFGGEVLSYFDLPTLDLPALNPPAPSAR